jgi:hypothetical protein
VIDVSRILEDGGNPIELIEQNFVKWEHFVDSRSGGSFDAIVAKFERVK